MLEFPSEKKTHRNYILIQSEPFKPPSDHFMLQNHEPALVLGCATSTCARVAGVSSLTCFKKVMFLPHAQQKAGKAVSADPQNGQYICKRKKGQGLGMEDCDKRAF